MRSEQDLKETIDQYADTVKRICVVYLKSKSDTDDIFQTVFLKYYHHSAQFESEEHKKAWLIRVTVNACKDFLKSFFRKQTSPLETLGELSDSSTDQTEAIAVRQAVQQLPEKYKMAIYLHYFEGYTAVEIGKILSKNVNTVYTLLARGREALKQMLGGHEDEW